jgi:hypothetical protein
MTVRATERWRAESVRNRAGKGNPPTRARRTALTSLGGSVRVGDRHHRHRPVRRGRCRRRQWTVHRVHGLCGRTGCHVVRFSDSHHGADGRPDPDPDPTSDADADADACADDAPPSRGLAGRDAVRDIGHDVGLGSLRR